MKEFTSPEHQQIIDSLSSLFPHIPKDTIKSLLMSNQWDVEKTKELLEKAKMRRSMGIMQARLVNYGFGDQRKRNNNG